MVDGAALAVGNEALMADYAVDLIATKEEAERLAGEGKTPMYIAINGKLAGVIAVADPIKSTSREAIQKLNRLGLTVVMLTGDHQRTAEAIARHIGERVRERLPSLTGTGRIVRLTAVRLTEPAGCAVVWRPPPLTEGAYPDAPSGR